VNLEDAGEPGLSPQPVPVADETKYQRMIKKKHRTTMIPSMSTDLPENFISYLLI
jgi:hypothetical protein